MNNLVRAGAASAVLAVSSMNPELASATEYDPTIEASHIAEQPEEEGHEGSTGELLLVYASLPFLGGAVVLGAAGVSKAIINRRQD